MNRRYIVAVAMLVMVGCTTLATAAEFKSVDHRLNIHQKPLIAEAWLYDLVTHGESVVTSGVHSQYSLTELKDVLPRLSKDIKEQMDALVSSRGKTPEIISVDKGFAAKYADVLLAFMLIGSEYVLVDIDPVNKRTP